MEIHIAFSVKVWYAYGAQMYTKIKMQRCLFLVGVFVTGSEGEDSTITKEILQMKSVRRSLSAVLALALLLGCMGWTPTRAEEATLETNPGTVTENIQAQDSVEKIDIL